MNNPIRECFETSARKAMKVNQYFDKYLRHFKDLKERASPKNKIRFLEIGIWNGGSIEMWQKYFGEDNIELHMIDINPSCKSLESKYPKVKIYIGDQADKGFLESIVNTTSKFDVILDDGGHTMIQQITTFEVLYKHVKPGGYFVCEDLHTSYWDAYGGGYLKAGTFIEFAKNKIDSLNAHHGQDPRLTLDDVARTCYGIHAYGSIIFFEKSLSVIEKSFDVVSGYLEV
jgi:hypothetical protein